MRNILIVGYGIVGHNLSKEISNLKPDIFDKYKTECNTKRNIKYDIAFICVDTPLKENFELDISEVLNAIKENDSEIYVIKSTCPLGTVDKFKEITSKRIIFSPEYYGGTQHCNNFDFDFTILGGDKNDCIKVVQVLQNCYDARHTFRIVDSKTAELVKFMENSWLATKVSFCQSFYNVCKNNNLNYEELRELFVLDPRVNASHTFVYENSPYWDSHCLNKDVPHIAYNQNMELLKSVIDFNIKQKKEAKNDKSRSY